MTSQKTQETRRRKIAEKDFSKPVQDLFKKAYPDTWINIQADQLNLKTSESRKELKIALFRATEAYYYTRQRFLSKITPAKIRDTYKNLSLNLTRSVEDIEKLILAGATIAPPIEWIEKIPKLKVKFTQEDIIQFRFQNILSDKETKDFLSLLSTASSFLSTKKIAPKRPTKTEIIESWVESIDGFWRNYAKDFGNISQGRHFKIKEGKKTTSEYKGGNIKTLLSMINRIDPSIKEQTLATAIKNSRGDREDYWNMDLQ